MRTIAIINQKGGCGKTTCSINLAAALAQEGQRTLLVDMDPQSHCALGLAVPEGQIRFSSAELMRAGLDGSLAVPDVVWQIARYFDLVPSSMALAAIEAQLQHAPDKDRRLAQILSTVQDKYDFCIIDCPPSIGLLTFNALRAATEVIVPVETGYFSMEGAKKQHRTIEMLARRAGHNVQFSILPTMYDVRTKLAREILAEIKRHFSDNLLPMVINFNAKLKEAASFGQPITEYDATSRGMQDFEQLAKHLIETPLNGAIHDDAIHQEAQQNPALSRAAELVERARSLSQRTTDLSQKFGGPTTTPATTTPISTATTSPAGGTPASAQPVITSPAVPGMAGVSSTSTPATAAASAGSSRLNHITPTLGASAGANSNGMNSSSSASLGNGFSSLSKPNPATNGSSGSSFGQPFGSTNGQAPRASSSTPIPPSNLGTPPTSAPANTSASSEIPAPNAGSSRLSGILAAHGIKQPSTPASGSGSNASGLDAQGSGRSLPAANLDAPWLQTDPLEVPNPARPSLGSNLGSNGSPNSSGTFNSSSSDLNSSNASQNGSSGFDSVSNSSSPTFPNNHDFIPHNSAVLTDLPSAGQSPLMADPSLQAQIPERLDPRVAELYGVRKTSQGLLFVQPKNGAVSMAIAGDFNGWNPEQTKLKLNEDMDVWQAVVPVPSGRYRYRLVVDGKWVKDPYNGEVESNPFGELNNIITVK